MKDRKSAIKSFEIAIEGTLSTPTLMAESRYTTINILYNIECRTLKEQIEISRAVNLAHDKYCGLVQMLKMIAPSSARYRSWPPIRSRRQRSCGCTMPRPRPD